MKNKLLIILVLVMSIAMISAQTPSGIAANSPRMLTAVDAHHDRNPSFFRASDGRYWLFFVHGSGTEKYAFWDVYYMTSTDEGATWSAPTVIPSSTGQRGMAAFQDNTGKIWVFVSAPKDLCLDTNIHYYTFDGTTWTGPTDIPGPISGSHVDAFQATDGKIWVFYESAGVKAINTPNYGTTWSSVITVSPTSGDGIPKAIEAGGKLYVGYCNWAGGAYYYRTTTDGLTGNSWSAAQTVIDVPGTQSNDPVLYEQSSGKLWLFYAPYNSGTNSQWIEMMYSLDGGVTWSSRINVTTGGYGGVYWDDMWPEVTQDTAGNIILFYTSESNADGTARIERNIWMMIAWSPPVGGVWVPINKFELLAPWIGLVSLMTIVMASVIYVKHRKKQQN